MDLHQTIVIATLAAKSSAETPSKTCFEDRSETMRRTLRVGDGILMSYDLLLARQRVSRGDCWVRRTPKSPLPRPSCLDSRSLALVLVMATPPDSCLVASLRSSFESLIHSPEAIQSERTLNRCGKRCRILRFQQIDSRCEPLFTCSGFMLRHLFLSLHRVFLIVVPRVPIH